MNESEQIAPHAAGLGCNHTLSGDGGDGGVDGVASRVEDQLRRLGGVKVRG
jgi:hypothetical protein